jgi:hypothetical protein
MAFDVFISYSQKDCPQAEAICAKLEEQGLRCWIAPRNILPGEDWAEAIIRALNSCRAVVVIFSEGANESPQVKREVQRAFEKKLTVMPFRIEDVMPNPGLEYYMGGVHWLDALTRPLDPHIEKLALLLKSYIGTTAPPQDTPTVSLPPGVAAGTAQAAGTPAEVDSVIQESRKDAADNTGVPLRLLLQFNKAIVAGYSSTIAIRVENRSASPLENVAITLESNGLTTSPSKLYRQMPAGCSTSDILEIEPVRGGNFVLRCRVQLSQAGNVFNLRGATQFAVNATAGNQGGYVNAGAQEDFTLIPLEIDYEVSAATIEKAGAASETGRIIPRAFLSAIQPGTKLILEPAEPSGFVRGLQLVARPEFKLGRSKDEADFLTWFWPRSPDNDLRTRKLSRVHAVGAIDKGRIFLRDAGSTNESTFEGHPLKERQNDPIDQRGALILGHEYALDVMPFPSALPEGVIIDNIRLWNGSPAAEPAVRGSMRFLPTNSEVSIYDALWLFTDANFGCSRLNPLVLDLPGIPEVAGRFVHYRGCFWIEAFEGANIRIGETLLHPREIAPITSRHPIFLGKTAFTVAIEA